MGVFNNWPYTDVHQLNLDFILDAVKDYKEKAEELDSAVETATTAAENAAQSELNAKASEDAAELAEQNIRTYTAQLKQQVTSNTNQINVHTSEIAAIISGTTPDANAELIDIRVAADGATYPTAGDAVRAQINDIMFVDRSVNLLNPANVLSGYYYKAEIEADNRYHVHALSNAAFSCAYIDVTSGTDYIVTGISYNAYTADADGFAIGLAKTSSQSTPDAVFDTTAVNNSYNNTDKTITRVYFSWRHANYPVNTFMAVQGTTLPLVYVPYKNIKQLDPDMLVDYNQIINIPEAEIYETYIVDINGTGDYTSFTACIRALANNVNKKIIYVKAGEYDIFNEIGGQAYAESIINETDWFDVSDFIPPNTKIIGLGEVVFKFKPTATQIPSNVASLLSPVNVIYDVYMENITIDCDNCRYGIHDDTGHIADVIETRHIYKNVNIIKKRTNYGMDAAFGCGMQRGQYMEFECCNFSSPDRPFSFHNKGTSGAVDNTIIVIKNSIAISNSNGNALRFGNVNEYQVKISVRVFNTYLAGQIKIKNESSVERPNAFALTLSGCGTPVIDIENATNIYTPVVY